MLDHPVNIKFFIDQCDVISLLHVGVWENSQLSVNKYVISRIPLKINCFVYIFELIDMDVIIHVKWGITKHLLTGILVNMHFVRPSNKNVALSLPVSGKILFLGPGKIIQCPWSPVNKCMVLGCVSKENIHVN